MDKSPLITIIVSVYNGERYLEECIESVLNQDYQQIELIAVDDGSSDFSGRILDKYAQKDKRMIVGRVNQRVQHYEIFLKKTSAGVEKLSFSLGLALIFFL
ncbi:glycosyltransferase, partial [Bacteroides sp. An269]|uniref:glycosyltransferase family 2 protein n=1 Tax=Bacteroides sp. An269 TaxID=1965613 RepID=UPI001178755A